MSLPNYGLMQEKSQTGEPIRVLQVVRPAAGGMRRHVSLLCRGLEARDFRVQVAAPEGFLLDMGASAPVRPVPIRSDHRLFSDVRAAIAVARLARGADLIHGHGLRGGWITSLASRRSRKPYLLTAHNLAPIMSGQLAPRLVRSSVERADAKIAVSRAVAESFQEIGIDPLGWTVIPNGVDLIAFEKPPDSARLLRSLDLPQNAHLIVSIGRLAPEKGFDRLIDAAKIVCAQKPDIFFVLAGEG